MAQRKGPGRRQLSTVLRTYRAIRLLQRLMDVDDPASLDWVIDTFEEVLPLTPPEHHDHGVIVNNLGIARHLRYDRLGDRHDLDETVRMCLLAVRGAVPATLGGRLNNLAGALVRRHARTGDPTDLDIAVRAGRDAVTASRVAPRSRALYLSTLADTLGRRFRLTADPADLDEMVAVAAEAVAAAPPGHPEVSLYLGRLGAARMLRYRRDGDPADLDAAIEVARTAVDAIVDATYRNRAGRLPAATAEVESWTRALRERNAQRGRSTFPSLRLPGDPGPLGFDAEAGEHPDRAGRLLNLSLLLLERHLHDGSGDLVEALAGLSTVAGSTAAPAHVRLRAAHLRAVTIGETEEQAAALPAYEIAIALLPLLAWRGIGQRDQQHLLREHASLGRDAAASAIAAGRPDRALELLEQGRGVYWAQLLDTRTDLSALQAAAPELAAELGGCRRLLESAGAPGGRHQAARRFDELVEQARALPPGAELPHPAEFLRPPSAARLLPPAGGGPVVLVNLGRGRCDALILTAAGVETVPLPGVTAGEVVRVAGRHLDALERRDDPAALDAAITGTLDWLWWHLAEPVLRHLGHTAALGPDADRPRLWWCPTGLLTALPLHAASAADGSGGVLDRVVSSYTPTARALVHARTRPTSRQPARLLVASLPRTPGQDPLPAAEAERRLVTGLLPGHTVLDGERAGRAALLDELTRHRWFHASCHGTQNLADPSAGGLLPYDWATAGLVSVVDLADARHHDGELAFLSACRTATGGMDNPDEVISIAAAMQHAGWRHVIGTMWSIPDDTAAAVTRGFYTRVVRDGEPRTEDAAAALHRTLRRLRDRHPDRPSAWAPFLHIGP
ncbi:CHAT domain-containing protein [Micromonosporaceae bacterium Da 78-11]